VFNSGEGGESGVCLTVVKVVRAVCLTVVKVVRAVLIEVERVERVMKVVE
jgi:hypothetical protein